MNSTVIKITLFRVFAVFILGKLTAGCARQTAYRLELMPREGLSEIYQIVDSRRILFGYLIYDSGDLVSFEKIDENKIKLHYQPQRPPDAP